MNRYIFRGGQKIELTWDDENLLFEQECRNLAEGAIENNCENANQTFDETTLFAIGREIYNKTWSENGEVEWDVLKSFELVD